MKLLIDGLEHQALEHIIELKCLTCGTIIHKPTKQALASHKLKKRYAAMLDDLPSSKFDYDFLMICENKHHNVVRIKFEEVQPSRYKLHLVGQQIFQASKLRRMVEFVLVVFLLSIIPLVVIFANLSLYQKYQRIGYLREYGVSTSGTVISRYGDSGGAKRAPNYELSYSYMVDGVNLLDTKDVDVNTYNLHDVGDQISIVYDPNNPSITDVEFNDEVSIELFSVVFLDVVLLVVIIVIYKKSKS